MKRTTNANLWKTSQHTPLPCFSQPVSILVERISAANLGAESLDADFMGTRPTDVDSLSIDGSAYQNRLEPTINRSGERRHLAAIPS